MSQSLLLLAIVSLSLFTPAIRANAETDRNGGITISEREQKVASPVVWKIDNLEQIGGLKPIVLGAPSQIVTEHGPALTFNGDGDGLFVPVHPLQKAKKFTVEIVFRPTVGGEAEQRFFHMQEKGSENRVMFETRVVGENQWFLDTFIKTDNQETTLYAEKFLHRLGAWYHLALVVDGKEMRHYVNGVIEMTAPHTYAPQGPGKTSIGMRINKVFWYHGDIREARFTRRVLSPSDFHLHREALRVP